MQKVLKNISDDRLRAYIIWLPILWSDNRASAEKRAGEFADHRVTYFWDGDRLTGKAWQRALGLSGVAWDVYFVYGAAARWEKEPTVPDFWMHQLSVAENKAPFLNEPEFEVKVKGLLGKIQSADQAKETLLGGSPPDAKAGATKSSARAQASPSDGKLATVTIHIEGMTCGGCAVSVRQALAKRAGVKSVEVSFEQKRAIVKYDPAKVTPEQLAEAINQIGFKAREGAIR
jgi:copper chaperone CopZ